MTIWGNHSDTQYPDFQNARINGKPAPEVISDKPWFTETFVPTVAKRGAAVIKARGASSAASAANAIVDSIRSLTTPRRPTIGSARASCPTAATAFPPAWSTAIPSAPTDGRTRSIVPDLPIDDQARTRLDASAAELQSERDAVKDLLGPAT